MPTKVGLYKDEPNKGRPWVVHWYGEYNPETGKQRPYYESFSTKREAEAFRAAKQAEFNRGGQRDRPEEVSVSEFVERFVATRVSGQRIGTRKVYTNTLRQLTSYLGSDAPLRYVTPEVAERFITTRDRVAAHGEGYSPASRNQHLRNCRSAFRAAV